MHMGINDKKKLCIITPSHWSCIFGGAEQQVSLLLKELIERDIFELCYIARNVDLSFIPNGYKIEKIRTNWFSTKIGLMYDAGKLLAILNNVKPDIIYQRIGCAYTGIVAYYARHNNCKMVWHISSDANVLPFGVDKNISGLKIIRFFEKKFLEYGIRNTNAIIAQSQQQAELLFKFYGLQPTIIVPNYQPVPDIPYRKKLPVTIIWIANLKPMKQPEVFIKLAKDINENINDVRCLMIGRAGNSNWHSRVLNEISQTKCIDYLGEKTHEEVNELLSQAHILVNTSTYEGFPNTFIQAWLRELPVVSLNVNPDNVLVSHNIGFYSGSYKRFLEHVTRLIINDKLREEMGQKARKYAILKHSEINISCIIDELISKG